MTLCKNKGKKLDRSDYQGFTLLSIAGKILAGVLLNRLIPTIAQQNMPVFQYGLRSDREAEDMIFLLRQIQKKCKEWNIGLYAASVDLTEAFDTISYEGLWKILACLFLSPKIYHHPQTA